MNLHYILCFVLNGTREATEGGKSREHTCGVHGLLIAQPCGDKLKKGVDETKVSIGNVMEFRILAFQNREFKVFAFQNLEFGIWRFKILNSEFCLSKIVNSGF